jgi:hypothetical protein
MKKPLLWLVILLPFLATSCKDNILDDVASSAKQVESQNPQKSTIHSAGTDNEVVAPTTKVSSIAKPPKRKDKDWETSVTFR